MQYEGTGKFPLFSILFLLCLHLSPALFWSLKQLLQGSEEHTQKLHNHLKNTFENPQVITPAFTL